MLPNQDARVRREAGGISVDMAETRPAVACDEHLSAEAVNECLGDFALAEKALTS